MMTYLVGECISSKIAKRKLEPPIVAVDVDLDSDESIAVCC
jgi:hypothetical protein